MLEHKGFQGTVDISLEDNCLHGKILHINDTVIYESSSQEELEEAFIEAVEDYIELKKTLLKKTSKLE